MITRYFYRRVWLAVVASFLLPFVAQAQQPQEGTAKLHITIEAAQTGGQIVIALFDSADAFDNGGRPVRGQRIDVTTTALSAEFDGLPAGTYAMKAFHDQNGDGELTKNPFGLPIEPFAFSAGAQAHYGPPKFDAAKISVSAGTNTETLSFQP